MKLHGSYLQGMETFSPSPLIQLFPPARILPTRNGNLNTGQSIHDISFESTDPTYKEWKPLKCDGKNHRASKHGSYLQGMETQGTLFLRP